jgi:hypothetical protein
MWAILFRRFYHNSTSQVLIQLPTPERAVERVCATSIKEIEIIPVVYEFLDVFPDDLHGLYLWTEMWSL